MARALPAQFVANPQVLHHQHQLDFWKALDARTPSGRGWAFHRLALFAGRRGGKTLAGAVAAAKKLCTPDSVGWVCAPTYRDLEDFVMPEVFKYINPDWLLPGSSGWSVSSKTIRTLVNSKLQFRSLEDPETARGPGLDWAWIDEGAKIQLRAWQVLSPALVDKHGQAWITTTPKGPDWCYRSFYLPAHDGDAGYWARRYPTVENPVIDPLEIEKSRKDMDPLFFQQEYMADFVSFQGAVYGNTLDSQILEEHDDDRIRQIIPEWPAIHRTRACLVGIDVGTDHPFAAVLLLVTEAGLVVIGEYLQRHRSTREHAVGMKELLAWRNREHPLEPELWARDKSAAQAGIDLSLDGIWTQPAPNKVEDGVRRVQSWLHGKQLWFLRWRCPQLLDQLYGLRWAEGTSRDGGLRKEVVIKVDDDLPDALRYALATYPELPEPAVRLHQPDARYDGLSPDARWQVDRMRRVTSHERDTDLTDWNLGTGTAFVEEPAEGENSLGDFWGS